MKKQKKKSKKVVKKKTTKTKTKSKKTTKPVEKKLPKLIPSGIECIICENDIPQQRIDALTKMGKPANKCINCSNEKTKKPIVQQFGEGDHTYTEVTIVDDETYKKYEQFEEANRRMLGISKRNDFEE